MIYYKKKNFIKKILTNVHFKKADERTRVAPFLKFAVFLFVAVFAIFYFAYLYLIPNYVNEENIKKPIENCILKNTNLSLLLDDLTIKPDYKFNIQINAKYLKLINPDKTEFIFIEHPKININLFSLLCGYIDINDFNAKKFLLHTKFTKEKRYECFKYLKLNEKNNSKLQLRNVNLNIDNLSLLLFDENINKEFSLKSSKLKVFSNQYLKLVNINSNGAIYAKNHKLNDYNLNLSIKLNPSSIGKFKEKLVNLNYNPLYHADKYKAYTKSDINLKIFTNPKKTNIEGYINFVDFDFWVNNIKFPKNNILLRFKSDKIFSDCDFKLINNQEIKIKSNAVISKNKKIEMKLTSSEIQLCDLNEMLMVFCEIFNSKVNLNEVALKGLMQVDIYLKSNFKIINSNGKLLVKDGEIYHKKTGLRLKNINSDINFANNNIKILNAKAYINDAQFNIFGNIDSKTNLNLNIDSELINMAQVMTLLKDLSFTSFIVPKLKDYSFKNGFLKINASVGGNFKNPIIKTNSILSDLKIFSKKLNINLSSNKIIITANPSDNKINDILVDAQNVKFNYQNKSGIIPKIGLKIGNNNINISKTDLIFEKIPIKFEGIIKNINTAQSEAILKFAGNIPLNNNFLVIKKENVKFLSTVILKQDKLFIESFNISDLQKTLITISGSISNLSQKPLLNDIRIILNDRVKIFVPEYYGLKFDVIGNINLSGTIELLNYFGKLNFYNIRSDEFNLKIDSASVNIKNSEFYLNILNGAIFDFNFDLISGFKFQKNKLIVDYLKYNSNYINFDNFNKYFNKSLKNNQIEYEINNLEGNIQTLEIGDILLNLLSFSGNIKNNVLNVENFEAETLNGKISGNAKLNLKNYKVDAKINLKELNIRHLSNKLRELSIAASGKLSAVIDAQFIGFDIDEILKTINGNIKFSIENGELSQFAKLERFLQAGNILSQGFLKLTLNSTLSTITKQNTGDFKIIEGNLKVCNSIAEIENLTSSGSNMSLYLNGYFNLLTQYAQFKVLGRIPNSIVSVLGNFGSFSLSKLDSNNNTQPKFSIKIPDFDIKKIPPLAYNSDTSNTREFVVFIDGIITNLNSIRDFKWAEK